MGYIDVYENHEEDDYPSKEDLYSLELDFKDTYVCQCVI